MTSFQTLNDNTSLHSAEWSAYSRTYESDDGVFGDLVVAVVTAGDVGVVIGDVIVTRVVMN